MGFITYLMQKLKKNNIPDLIEKTSESGNLFTDINNDLSAFIDAQPNCDALTKMTYGYARRSAAAGMYINGSLNRTEYEYVTHIFSSLQKSTDQSEKFQALAANISVNLLSSYTGLLNHDNISIITIAANTDNITPEAIRLVEDADSDVYETVFVPGTKTVIGGIYDKDIAKKIKDIYKN